jgi:hypothetical protein
MREEFYGFAIVMLIVFLLMTLNVGVFALVLLQWVQS